MAIDAFGYFAWRSLSDYEGFTLRAIASAMEFALDLKYVDVCNANRIVDNDAEHEREIERVEALL
jgi:hypothetical protein